MAATRLKSSRCFFASSCFPNGQSRLFCPKKVCKVRSFLSFRKSKVEGMETDLPKSPLKTCRIHVHRGRFRSNLLHAVTRMERLIGSAKFKVETGYSPKNVSRKLSRQMPKLHVMHSRLVVPRGGKCNAGGKGRDAQERERNKNKMNCSCSGQSHTRSEEIEIALMRYLAFTYPSSQPNKNDAKNDEPTARCCWCFFFAIGQIGLRKFPSTLASILHKRPPPLCLHT